MSQLRLKYTVRCIDMEREVIVRIRRKAMDIWRKIRDIKSIKNLIAEIDRIEVLEDHRTYVVWFKLNLGILEKRYQTLLETYISEEKLSVDYFINNRHIEVKCSIQLNEIDDETDVRFRIATRPKDALGKLVESAIYNKMEKYKENILNLI